MESAISDLSDWDLKQQPIRTIEGNWEFYWKELISVDQFKQIEQGALSSPTQSIPVPIPQRWSVIDVSKIDSLQPISAPGWATYRKKIILPESLKTISFRVPSFITAYKFWVNGDLLLEQGLMTTKSDEAIMAAGNQTAIYRNIPDNNELDIIIHVSSFNHKEGGGMASDNHRGY